MLDGPLDGAGGGSGVMEAAWKLSGSGMTRIYVYKNGVKSLRSLAEPRVIRILNWKI